MDKTSWFDSNRHLSSLNQVRSELNTRGVAGTATLARRLREISERNVGRDGHACLGVGEVDFRRALKEIHLPLTESDARRLFTHFEVWDTPKYVAPENTLRKGVYKTIQPTVDHFLVSPLFYSRRSLSMNQMRDSVLFMTG